MDLHYFWIFLATTALAIISPGASALLVVSKTATMGTRGAATIAGFGISVVLYFILSGLGVTAIIATSQKAFTVIKWIGVAYLAYLGLTALLSKSGGLQVAQSKRKTQSIPSLISQGFIVEFANPKAWMYFAALLPTFTDLSRPLIPQFMIMIVISLTMQWIIYGAYGFLAVQITKGAIGARFVTWLNRIIGGALLLAAFKMAQLSLEKA